MSVYKSDLILHNLILDQICVNLELCHDEQILQTVYCSSHIFSYLIDSNYLSLSVTTLHCGNILMMLISETTHLFMCVCVCADNMSFMMKSWRKYCILWGIVVWTLCRPPNHLSVTFVCLCLHEDMSASTERHHLQEAKIKKTSSVVTAQRQGFSVSPWQY